MAEVDPVTGMPKESTLKSVFGRLDRLDAQKVKYNQLMEDLSSERGQVIINKIKEHLLVRVNKLIDEDGECRALKKLLVDMGVTLNLGEMAVEKLSRLLVRKQTP